jgi:hypothetical protein
VHYIGGLVGLILTGIFAQQDIIALSYNEGDTVPLGGWLDGNFIQLPIQLAAIVTVSVWSFVVTYIILVVINKIPFLRLRLNDEAEMMGVDWAEMGERAYAYLPVTESGDFITPNATSTSADVAKGVVVKRIPDLIEEPVEGKDMGGIKLQDMDLSNSANFFSLDGRPRPPLSPTLSARTDASRNASSGSSNGMASSSTTFNSSKQQQKAKAID